MMTDKAESDARRQAVTSAASDAYLAARSAVLRIAQAEGSEIREMHIWPGSISTTRYAEPMAGIRAARILERTAGRVTDDYIRFAREDGAGWLQIGEALGLAEDGDPRGYELAVAAYEYAAGKPDLWGNNTFYYSCPSCAQTISDRGPYQSHPEDNEQGHGQDCARLAADIAAWQADQDAWGGRRVSRIGYGRPTTPAPTPTPPPHPPSPGP